MPQDSTKIKASSSDELINLNEAEEHLRAVSKTSLDGLIITDQGGKIIFWNKAATEIFGHEPEETMGKYVTVLMPEQGKEAYARARERVLGQGISKFGTRPREMTAKRKDGTEIIIEAAMTHWKLRDRYYFGGTFRDVTERKQQEKALKDSEERFRAIAESSLDAIFISDSNGTILYSNKSVERIYGYTAEELAGESIEILECEKERNKYRKARENYKHMQSTFVGKIDEGTALHKNGREFSVEVSTSTWKIQDKLYFSGIARDTTERKQMEEQLRKSHEELEKKVEQRTAELSAANKKLRITQEYLKKFAGMLLSAREEERKNISTTLHDELGSLALAVTSRISIAQEEVRNNDRKAALKTLEEGQAAVRKAVEDLRRLAVDLRPPNLEIMGLPAALTDLFKKSNEHAPFKISFINELGVKKIDDDRAIVIYRLTQEALTNIAKHARAKQVQVRLRDDRTTISLEIADDGVGFKQDKPPKRANQVKIGIQGMRERVESLGGEFIITSEPRQGTQIHAVLPKK